MEINKMPKTKFKLDFGEKVESFQIDKFQQSLPTDFTVYEDNGEVFISVETAQEEDKTATGLVERELNRYFFLTGEKIKSKIQTRGSRLSNRANLLYYNDLPDDITAQNWSSELAIQLKLWSIIDDLYNDRVKILFYFQIIELTYPEKNAYPEYTDATQAPDPLTECKFLRHLVAHAGDVASNPLKKYCQYLGISEIMSNIIDHNDEYILKNKLPLLQEQAKFAIQKNLQQLGSDTP